MPDTIQLAFSGVDACSAPDKVPENFVTTAKNIDFSLEPGAAAVRLGSVRKTTTALGTGPIRAIYRHYKNDIDSSCYYIRSGSVVSRGTALGTLTAISTLTGAPDDRTGFTAFHNYAWIAQDQPAQCLKDDGTSATTWVLTAPAAAVAATPLFGSPLDIKFGLTGAYTSVQSGDTALWTMTALSTGNAINMTVNGSNKIEPWGSDVLIVRFNKPNAVMKIRKQYALDTAFNNYWSVELDPKVDLNPSPSQVPPSGYATFGSEIDNNPRKAARYGSEGRTSTWYNMTLVTPRDSEDRFTPEGAPGSAFNTGWTSIVGVRIVVECTEEVTMTFVSWGIYGDSQHSLSDLGAGIFYRETFAVTDTDGNTLQETGGSPISDKMTCRQAGATVVSTNTHAGSIHGITHRVLYRQGGTLKDFYATSTLAYTTAVATYTDTLDDLTLVTSNHKLDLDVSTMPGNAVCVSEPFYEHIVVGHENMISWSAVGEYGAEPGKFPSANFAVVSHAGDQVYGLVVWPPGMVIVNRDSVYEWYGQVFDGPDQDHTLQRTGSRHGSKASRAIIKTPYGIPLIEYDGFYMFIPGQGTDFSLDWVDAQIGDAWKGYLVAHKGNRIPVLNKGYLRDSVAAFRDNKLYLGMPCDNATAPNTLFVIDFHRKQCWWYSYPFNFNAIFHDFVDDVVLIGTTDGYIMQAEINYIDQGVNGTDTGIPWNFKTRQWTAPADTVVENIAVEYKGPNAVAYMHPDGGTMTLGTFTNTDKAWQQPTGSATIGSNLAFSFAGTQTNTTNPCVTYAVGFDAMIEPKRIKFYKTEYDIAGHEGEKIWDIADATIDVIGTGTVSATRFVDAVAVMTNTVAGPTNGPLVKSFAYPANTYGNVGHTIYTAGAGITFKLWRTGNQTRPEPTRINFWRTDIQSLDENRCEAISADINPNGTATCEVMIDNAAVGTATFTGTNRQSYTWALPPYTYGRTIYANYTGVGFKHYNTWWKLKPEPDRWHRICTPVKTYPSTQTLKTWVVDINPVSQTVVGTMFANGTAIQTNTFVGGLRSVQNAGIDMPAGTWALNTAIDVYALYTSTGSFKHYDTDWETEAMPFAKTTWGVTYKKLGGATQIDMPRFWSYDIEVPTGTATITSKWDADGVVTHTSTLTLTAGRAYGDQIPLTPGMRGRLFRQLIQSSAAIRVWKSTIDMERVGVKGLSRVTLQGTPQ